VFLLDCDGNLCERQMSIATSRDRQTKLLKACSRIERRFKQMSGKCTEKRDWKAFSAKTIASELRSESNKKRELLWRAGCWLLLCSAITSCETNAAQAAVHMQERKRTFLFSNSGLGKYS
jgi:hypothetical protein